jgi:hypothetical protein
MKRLIGCHPGKLPVLAAGQQDYIKPSIYETDNLLEVPASVTEGTTKNLKSGE